MTDSSADPQRIPSVEDPTADSPLLRVLANNPRLYEVIRKQTELLVAGSVLPVRVRWLITIRMAWRCHGQYVLTRHGPNAPEEGLLEVATGPADAAGVEEGDHLILAMVDQLFETQDLDDELFDALAARWSVPDVLELVALCTIYWQAAAVSNVARVQWRPREGDPRAH